MYNLINSADAKPALLIGPLCPNGEQMKEVIFSQSRVPILQNRVYSTAEEAKSAAVGDLEICLEGGFGWNDKFNEKLIKYNDQYNNSVPSSIFDAYYDRIADYLASRYDIISGPVVDVGCGKGTFLKRMANRYKFKGIGIDPSYEGHSTVGNLTFIAEEFSTGHVEFEPSLVLCRHTLEHIPDPTAFLASIIDAFPRDLRFPLFCEVPDLSWIIEQKSWWDFCYEHVNYFSSSSFRRCLKDAGCGEIKVIPEFGGQYLWAEGIANSKSSKNVNESQDLTVVVNMNDYVEGMIQRSKKLSRSRRLVIWGMATKGVMYALQAGSHGVHISYGVDINKEKQGKFAPVSGLRINAPEDLPLNESYAVICMNPNYTSEIAEQLEQLNLDFVLVTP
jgi:SAM-dependent methyltransferase